MILAATKPAATVVLPPAATVWAAIRFDQVTAAILLVSTVTVALIVALVRGAMRAEDDPRVTVRLKPTK